MQKNRDKLIVRCDESIVKCSFFSEDPLIRISREFLQCAQHFSHCITKAKSRHQDTDVPGAKSSQPENCSVSKFNVNNNLEQGQSS